MGSLGNPKIWVPDLNTKDCSQGFCTIYCRQWCYIIFPPPPPFAFPDDDSSPNFSPLVIAIIGILASAFLLVSYYTIISKYCWNSGSARRENQDPSEELEENHNPSLHEPWNIVTTGLDGALIRSITVCKYKKGDGLIEGTDCSICLGEFQEDESLRLLPKCSHAFHLPCIDTWLISHSNCPLCRANIVCINAPLLQLPPPVAESRPDNESSSESQNQNESLVIGEDVERGVGEEESLHGDFVPKTPLRAFSDLGNLEGRDTIIEIRDEGDQPIRRSVSMDFSRQSRVSIADILRINDPDEHGEMVNGVGSSKPSLGEISKSSRRNRVLHCVISPVAMKRSFSSGRFLFSRHG